MVDFLDSVLAITTGEHISVVTTTTRQIIITKTTVKRVGTIKPLNIIIPACTEQGIAIVSARNPVIAFCRHANRRPRTNFGRKPDLSVIKNNALNLVCIATTERFNQGDLVVTSRKCYDQRVGMRRVSCQN